MMAQTTIAVSKNMNSFIIRMQVVIVDLKMEVAGGKECIDKTHDIH